MFDQFPRSGCRKFSIRIDRTDSSQGIIYLLRMQHCPCTTVKQSDQMMLEYVKLNVVVSHSLCFGCLAGGMDHSIIREANLHLL